MVDSALDASAATTTSALAEGETAYYLDYGHTRRDIDGSRTELLARELWEDLDDTAATASRVLSELIETLHGSGNLARAAAASQQLVELAVGLNVALGEAYQLAHRQRPGPPRP
jgi:phage-related minor tail protein